MSEHYYSITLFPEPDEFGFTASPDTKYHFSVPFESDPETLKCLALEYVGVYSPLRQSVFTIESDESGGHIVRDGENEPFMSIELDEDFDPDLEPIEFPWEG